MTVWLSKETQIAAIPKNSFNNQRCNNWKTYSNFEEKEKNPVSGAMPSLLVWYNELAAVRVSMQRPGLACVVWSHCESHVLKEF